jgi:hypothetical protein
VIARLIFIATYLVLALVHLPFVRVDRTAAAIIGAVATIAAGGLTLDQACRAIGYRTLILLFGMMALVATLRLGAFFRTRRPRDCWLQQACWSDSWQAWNRQSSPQARRPRCSSRPGRRTCRIPVPPGSLSPWRARLQASGSQQSAETIVPC